MGDDISYSRITCSVLLVLADSLTDGQLERKRTGENSLEPLTEASIDRILASWKRKLMREVDKHGGYMVMGYDA